MVSVIDLPGGIAQEYAYFTNSTAFGSFSMISSGERPNCEIPFSLNPFSLNPFSLNPFSLNPFSLNPFSLKPFCVSPLVERPFSLNPLCVMSPTRELPVLSRAAGAEQPATAASKSAPRQSGDQPPSLVRYRFFIFPRWPAWVRMDFGQTRLNTIFSLADAREK